MALIIDSNKRIFDLTAINRGDCVRIRRAGDTTLRNGIVTRTGETQITILYANIQNNATSFFDVRAADVAIGLWEMWYTTDFINIGYENNTPDGLRGEGATQ